MIDYFDKILFINLDRDTKKKNQFLAHIQQSSIKTKIVRFKAVDGKKLDIRLLDKTIVSENAIKEVVKGKQKHFGVSMTYGALGCALSHYLILKECKIATKPYLIFEDDSRIIDNFDTHISQITNHIENNKINFDIVYLGLHNIPALNKKKSYDELLYIPQGLTCGTWAMIISPSGAQKILNYAFPLSVQIDSEISRVKTKMNVYATKMELATHSWSFGSSTQQQRGCQTDTNIYG